MFKEIGQIASLFRNLPNLGKIKEEAERYQQRLKELVAEGDAGGGMVKVRVNGRMEVLNCTLSDEARKMGDHELLEDLIKSAVNSAIDKARALAGEEASKMATNMGLPPGMSLPGMG